MPLEVISGNLFDQQVDALVNPVNCEGVSGAGLALQFRRRYPYNQEQYAAACAAFGLKPGGLLLVDLRRSPKGQEGQPFFIVNLPTKTKWRDRLSNLSAMQRSLWKLPGALQEVGVQSVAIPALGCGLGRRSFNAVLPLIAEPFRNTELRIVVLRPQ